MNLLGLKPTIDPLKANMLTITPLMWFNIFIVRLMLNCKFEDILAILSMEILRSLYHSSRYLIVAPVIVYGGHNFSLTYWYFSECWTTCHFIYVCWCFHHLKMFAMETDVKFTKWTILLNFTHPQSWVGTPLMDIYICMIFLDYAYKFR